MNPTFAQAYNKLNKTQRKAVDTTEGPVIVVAGPGTGKTELLAVRAGKILTISDVQPHNILCITYTEAGAYAMRTRLLKYIGPAAYQVAIHTYHGFCNMVIQENLETFGSNKELQAATDLEQVEVLMEIIDELPDDNTLKRFKGDRYYDRYNLSKLFQTMKEENWSIDFLSKKIDESIAALKEDPDMYYKRASGNNKKGDLKEKAYQAAVKKLERTRSAAQLYPEYIKKMAARDRFDFQDMILWVLAAFKENDELLGRYQERFQYIMLDEYQDTNGAQNELVFQLSDFWEKPNLFAVGDDDQSIFRFQGANLNNIVDFVNKYDPTIIVLEQNYRSQQAILDIARSTIKENKSRLINKVDGLSKELVESRDKPDYIQKAPEILRYKNAIQQEVGILHSIQNMISKHGCTYNDFAIIYTKHKEVNNLIKYLQLNDIPFQVRKKVDVLTLPAIQQLVRILRYIEGELREPFSQERKLFQILHSSFFNISPIDLAQISIFCSRKTDETEDDRRWRTTLRNKSDLENLGLENTERLGEIGELIENWIISAQNDTLQVMVEKIMSSSGWLEEILRSEDKQWNLQIFNTFFNLIKEESAKNTGYSLSDFLITLEKMQLNNIPLPVLDIRKKEEGITLVTAHSSKGLEFKYVYILNMTEKTWKKKNYNRGFYIPESIIPISATSDVEDDRRLFYVAITRAEHGLFLCYPDHDEKDKEIVASSFLYDGGIEVPETYAEVPEELLSAYQMQLLLHRHKSAPIIDTSILEDVLQEFKISATALSKFLKCGVTFYFENLLRVPMARTAPLGFGNAIHYALEKAFGLINADSDETVFSEEKLLELFSRGMGKYQSHFNEKEWVNINTYGKEVLKNYYKEYKSTWKEVPKYKLEHAVDNIHYKGVPIKGKLDKLEIYKHHVNVVDYKTGKYASKKLKPPLGDDDIGGDYWRQLVFYKILIDQDAKYDYNYNQGIMDFVEYDEANLTFRRHAQSISPMEVEIVGNQVEDTYRRIMNHEFYSCEEDTCRWCNFLNENGHLKSPLDLAEDPE